jgi:hypothetical protein
MFKLRGRRRWRQLSDDAQRLLAGMILLAFVLAIMFVSLAEKGCAQCVLVN